MKRYKHETGLGWLYWLIFLFIVFLFACNKVNIQQPVRVYDRYEKVIDWYTMDTAKVLNRTTWIYDSIWYEPTKYCFDTIQDYWFIDCSMPNVLQQEYYRKNGIKIQPSIYPK